MKLFLLFLSAYCCQAAIQTANLVLLEIAAQQKVRFNIGSDRYLNANVRCPLGTRELQGAVCLDGTPGGYYFRPGMWGGCMH